MLEEKKGNNTSGSAVTSQLAGVNELAGNVREELSKVTWTSREEMQLYIKVVVLSTLAFGLGVYIVDVFIQSILNGLGTLVQLISG